MKRSVCFFLTVCAAFLTSACAYNNDETASYKLNAVVNGVETADGDVLVSISPVVSYSPYSDTYTASDVFHTYTASDVAHAYGYARNTRSEDYSVAGRRWCMKSGNELTYKLRRQDRAEELTGLGADEIFEFTVMDGVIYGFENTDCVFTEFDIDEWYNDLYDRDYFYDD